MKTKLLSSLFLLSIIFFVSCGEGTDVVESGTYQGIIKEVEASKTEIYVETEDDKTLELYFTDQTELTQNGNVVDFSVLKEGMEVEVEVKKEGKRLDPISVKVLE
jgi:cold shock protein